MERVTVSVSFSLEDLQRFDHWREAKRLTRGAAIMTLLDEVEGVEEARLAPNWDDPNVAAGHHLGKVAEESRLAKARDALARAEAGENKGAFPLSAPVQARRAPVVVKPEDESQDPEDGNY